MFEFLYDVDADLVRVQKNIAKEFARIDNLLPASTTTATTVTADYLVKPTDSIVFCNAPAPMNITLPPSAAFVGQTFTIKNRSTPGAAVSIRGFFVNGASETIDGIAPYNIATGIAVRLYSTGTGWEVV